MIVAVIVAAGLGVRMGTPLRKQYLPLLGKPILCHTLQVFADCPAVDRLIVVLPEGQIEACRNSLLPLVTFREAQRGVLVPGGPTRQASVYRGLRETKAREEIVLVHDGVRPLVSPALIQACIDGARQWGACIPALAVRDTLKRVAADG